MCYPLFLAVDRRLVDKAILKGTYVTAFAILFKRLLLPQLNSKNNGPVLSVKTILFWALKLLLWFLVFPDMIFLISTLYM